LGATEIEKLRVADAAPAAARTVKFATPAALGVPEITPLLAPRASPAGSCPLVIDQV
jgi:hypothetical protein